MGSSSSNEEQQQQLQMELKLKKQAELQVLATDIYVRALTGMDVLLKKMGVSVPVQFKEYDLTSPTADVQDMLMHLEAFNTSLIVFDKMAFKQDLPLPHYQHHVYYADYYRKYLHLLPPTPEGQLVKQVLDHFIKSLETGRFQEQFQGQISENIMSTETRDALANAGTSEGIASALRMNFNAQLLQSESEAQFLANTHAVEHQLAHPQAYADQTPPGTFVPPPSLVSATTVHNLQVHDLQEAGYN